MRNARSSAPPSASGHQGRRPVRPGPVESEFTFRQGGREVEEAAGGGMR